MADLLVELEMQEVEGERDSDATISTTALASTHIELVQSIESALPPTAAPASFRPWHYSRFDRIVEHDLSIIKLICELGILPFEVDAENRKVSLTKSKIRWCWFYFITSTCLFKTIYFNGTLVASLLNPDWFQMVHLPVHLGFSITTYTMLVYLFLRPKTLRISAVLLNAVLAKRDRVKAFSRQQFIAAVLPIGCTIFAASFAFGFAFSTTIVYQVGTLLRVATTEWTLESGKIISPSAYGMLRVVAYTMDAFPLFWTLMGAIYMITSQLLILEVLYFWCDDLRVRSSRFNLADRYGDLVHIQLIVGLFNQVFAEVVFIQKLFCFSVGILTLATVFWYGFSGSLFMSVANLYGGIVCLCLYPLFYEKAALITDKIDMTKKSLLMAAAGLEDEKERAFWKRRVQSIRAVGILCGPRPIERESLPIFYDFFWSNFISVLLAT